MSPAIFLDRDGVIIENRANYVRSWADVELYPQALKTLKRIRAYPYRLILVTNQSVVGRGLIAHSTADAINDQLVHVIATAGGHIDAVYMCPHAPADACACRKPLPGLLLQAARDLSLDLNRSIMIGDALTDVAAGQAAGVRHSALVRTGRGSQQEKLPQAAHLPPFPVFDTLSAAVTHLLDVSD